MRGWEGGRGSRNEEDKGKENLQVHVLNFSTLKQMATCAATHTHANPQYVDIPMYIHIIYCAGSCCVS